jgi:hypothetical protein
MSLHRTLHHLNLGLAAGLTAASLGCDNGLHHNTLVPPGNRFELVIEANRTSVDASHFLLDTSTGDTWRLSGNRGEFEWVPLAPRPANVQPLDLVELLGIENVEPDSDR